MGAQTLYPAGPANVPAELTQPDSAYRLRVASMIGGLFLFVFLYIILVVAAGLLAWWLLQMPLPNIKGKGIIPILVFKFGGAFAMILLCVFLFKGLFKGQHFERSNYVPLSEKDHPELFLFIQRVYEETGAPRPNCIYVSPEVNAALVYDTSLINLFIPPRKDLLIGLGLVNVLNLSEFKAVMAHEFGHFAQRSVGLGSYLYVANRVITDIIYGRDALDRFVDEWSKQDIRLSFPAWGLKGVLWAVRKILAGTYQGLNLLHLSLSRQMEYNADNVAVSVSGSEALIRGLARLEFADECLADAARSLNAAADHNLFTDDIFYHQTQAAHRLRVLRKDERAGLPPEMSADPERRVPVFQPVSGGIPEKYRSHPDNYMRERNATRFYLACPQDERSPWLLFGKTAELRTAVSQRFYRHNLDRIEPYAPRPAAEIQQFIDAEHAESTHDPRYHGLYEDRFIEPGDLHQLPAGPWPREKAEAWLSNWPPADLEQKTKAYRERQNEYHLLHGLKSGTLTLKGKTFSFRDREHTAKDVSSLFAQVDKEVDADIQACNDLDRQAFLGHWSLAYHLDGVAHGPRQKELLDRYRFHMVTQEMLRTLLAEQARLTGILEHLSNNQELSAEEFAPIRDSLAEIHQNLIDNLEKSKLFKAPALANVPEHSTLHWLIADRTDILLPALSGDSITGKWLGKLSTRLEGVTGRLKRVHFKSLGRLLALQEKLAAEGRPTTVGTAGASMARTD